MPTFAARCLLAATTLLVAVIVAAAAAPVSGAAGDHDSLTYSTEPAAAAAGTSSILIYATPQSVRPNRLAYRLTPRDQRAFAAHQRANALRERASRSRKLADRYGARLAAINALLAAARSDEERLRGVIERRVVERYIRDDETLTAALAIGSVDGALETFDAASTRDNADAALVRDYEVSVQRVQELEVAVQHLQDLHARQAVADEELADTLDVHLVEARGAHLEASTVRRPDAGTAGPWLVTSPLLGVPSLAALGTSGGPWSGTETPHRKPTALQIAAVLADPRIDIYAGGREDIAAARIDGRVLDSLMMLAQRFGSVHVTSLISGHGVYTASGNMSMHTFGCAVDIGSVGGIVINSGTQGPGSVTEQAVRYLAAMPGDLAPHQVISLLNLGGPTIAMADHHDHIHLGYSC